MNPTKPILIAFTLLSFPLSAQDVEQEINATKQAAKTNPITVTGSAGANTVLYKPVGIEPRRDPFYWVFNANLNITILNKVSIPFTAVVTRQNTQYTNGLDKLSQPFTQFGISPKYRWLTVHAGYRSVNFSEYSLAGALFLGGGFEIKPEKSFFSAAAIYGRFEKAIPSGGIEGVAVDPPTYERWGGAAKVTAGSATNAVDLIFMKISDRVNSIPFDTANNVLPKENEVIAIATRQKLNRLFSVQGDLAFSMYTNNLFQDVKKLESYNYVNQIYAPRPSSHYDKALNLSANFTPGQMNLGLRYKRIDPDYRTLGGVFLTNDLEEISASAGTPILKKININVSAGSQKNNLDKVQASTSTRFIGACNLAYNVLPELNLNLNYSNFSSNSIPIRNAFSDTIKIVQLTQNGSFSFSYSKAGRVIRHMITGSSTYQQSGGSNLPEINYLNESLSYAPMFTKTGTSINMTFLYNQMTGYNTGDQTAYGPNLGASQTLLRKKIRLGLNAGFQNVLVNNQMISQNLTGNFNFSYVLDKNQSLKCDVSYIQRTAVNSLTKGFNETRASLGYVYQFLLKKNKTAKA